MAAQSACPCSIYSPPFYSSPKGYKMRLRLYLNGDAYNRGKHMSLFLVMMRGQDDDTLRWPFGFKVHFRLINQSTPNENQTHVHRAFWPDLRSTCFQRPNFDMNDAYGLQQFVPLSQLSDRPDVFIKGDVLFISAAIDFLAQRPGKAFNQSVRNCYPFFS